MNNEKLLTIAFIIVFAIGFYIASIGKESLGEINVIETPSVSTVEVGTVSTEVVSANVGRKYLQFWNTDANEIYCAIGETAVADTGIFVDATSTYAVNLDNLIIGAFNCISVSATSTISVIEK